MDINNRLMGQRVRMARRECGISAEQLGEKLDIAVESLWHIENGARRPSLQTLYSISEFLNVSLDYLVGRTDSPALIAAQSAASDQLTEEQAKLLLELAKSMVPVIRQNV